jgi:type IV secretory pathway VirD2 relaxase
VTESAGDSIRTPRLELEGQCRLRIRRDEYAEEAKCQENKAKIV